VSKLSGKIACLMALASGCADDHAGPDPQQHASAAQREQTEEDRREQEQLSLEQRDAKCAALSVSACKLDRDCRVLGGAQIIVEQQCIGEHSELGCQAENKGCDDAMTVARDAQGDAWLFGSTCIPASLEYVSPSPPYSDWVNWPACNPPPVQPPTPCAELRPDSCDSDRKDCVAVEALAYDPARVCVRGWKKVMCMPRTRGCTAAFSYARDPEGQAWQFTGGCQPEGWTMVSEAGPEPTPSWPTCSN
jgi:hypothetical protein